MWPRSFQISRKDSNVTCYSSNLRETITAGGEICIHHVFIKKIIFCALWHFHLKINKLYNTGKHSWSVHPERRRKSERLINFVSGTGRNTTCHTISFQKGRTAPAAAVCRGSFNGFSNRAPPTHSDWRHTADGFQWQIRFGGWIFQKGFATLTLGKYLNSKNR